MIHVGDLGNISDAEKEKLLRFFHEADARPVVRETHFFISQDPDIKDQGGVQHVLRVKREMGGGRQLCVLWGVFRGDSRIAFGQGRSLPELRRHVQLLFAVKHRSIGED